MAGEYWIRNSRLVQTRAWLAEMKELEKIQPNLAGTFGPLSVAVLTCRDSGLNLGSIGPMAAWNHYRQCERCQRNHKLEAARWYEEASRPAS